MFAVSSVIFFKINLNYQDYRMGISAKESAKTQDVVLIGNHSFFLPWFVDYCLNFGHFHKSVGRKFETLVVS